MKLLHTSDWHLGQNLYGRKRTREHSLFLNWLIDTINKEKVNILCVAGDIFDSTTPSNRSQALYYTFLKQIISTECKHVIITGGNHDSPSLLEAPKDLLKEMNVHVIGSMPARPEDEIIVIRDAQGVPQLIVCAVPYLRDRDIRTAVAGESIDEKGRNLTQGIANHYTRVIDLATTHQGVDSSSIPIVAMGHLFAAGCQSAEGDGVRELYVGTLAHVPLDLFPERITYLALGHLHSAQTIGGNNTRRYSGSPLPMGFGETNLKKQVLMVTLGTDVETVTSIEVPRFQKMRSIKGNLATILLQIERLKHESECAWVEILYEGEDIPGDLQEAIRNAVQGSDLELLRIVNKKMIHNVLHDDSQYETLDDLTVDDVFSRCLMEHEISATQQQELTMRFRESVKDLQENDNNAE